MPRASNSISFNGLLQSQFSTTIPAVFSQLAPFFVEDLARCPGTMLAVPRSKWYDSV
jgi:hypothetical protein